MKREEVENLLKQAKELNQSLENKEEFDFNELLSFLYRKGLIKALSNKDVKYGRFDEAQKKLTKLESKFAGFKLSRNQEEDLYTDLTFYKDVQMVGEMLGYELGSNQYSKKYNKLLHLPFPLFFGWYSSSVLVTMKNEPVESGIKFQGKINELLETLPKQVPGKPSEFKIEADNLDPQIQKSLLVYFAEGAMPRDTQVMEIKKLIDRIAESLEKEISPVV
jgi:hypothetical protein